MSRYKNVPKDLINRKLHDTMDNTLNRQNNVLATQTLLNRSQVYNQGVNLKMIKNRGFLFLPKNISFFKILKYIPVMKSIEKSYFFLILVVSHSAFGT